MGRWTIEYILDSCTTSSFVKCKCDCGADGWVRLSDLKQGTSKGCKPCMFKDRMIVPGDEVLSKKFRYLFKDIQKRCTNPEFRYYPRYGGRGIQNKFSSGRELADYMLTNFGPPGPKDELDRVDNNGHYEPGNVRWANRKMNTRNQERSVLLEGRSLIEALDEAGLLSKYAIVLHYVRKGIVVTMEEALNIAKRVQVEKEARSPTTERIKRLLPKTGYCYESIRSLIIQGLSDDEIIARDLKRRAPPL